MAAAKFAGASPEPGGGILPAQRAGWGPGGDVACPGEEGDARGGMLVVVRAHLGKQKKRCARLVREGDACKIKIPKAGISQGPAANPKSAGCSRARPRQRPCAPRSERGRGGGGIGPCGSQAGESPLPARRPFVSLGVSVGLSGAGSAASITQLKSIARSLTAPANPTSFPSNGHLRCEGRSPSGWKSRLPTESLRDPRGTRGAAQG